MFPVRLELQDSVRGSIQSMKENLRGIPNKGVGFGAFAIRRATGYSQHDLVPIIFNYLGQFDTSEGGDWSLSPRAVVLVFILGTWTMCDQH